MTALGWPAAIQPLALAVVLALAGTMKLASSRAAATARRSALTRLVGKNRVVVAFRVLGVVELLVAAAVLVPAARAASGWVAATMFGCMLGYLGYAKLRAPDTSCGCLGAKAVPVTGRAFARASLLALAGIATALAGTGWVAALTFRPLPALCVLAVECVAVVTLSAELDGYWLLPLRRWWSLLRHPLRRTSADTEVPLDASLQQLYRSPIYRSVHDQVRSTVLDTWDEPGWRMITFAAGDRHRIAVFAVPLSTSELAPERIRLAVVDDPDRPRETVGV